MKKGLLFLLALCCLALPVSAFSDVPETHWARESIDQAVESGVATGYADGTFRPAGAVTGAHFCAYLTRSFLTEELAAQPEAEGWTRIMDACAPILAGTTLEDAYKDSGSWGAFINQPLSRYDMAVILNNLLAEKGVELPSLEQRMAIQGQIGDWDSIPGRYQLSVATCYYLGLLNGQSGGTFGGDSSLSRAQACVIWSRLNALLSSSAMPEAPEEAETPEEPVADMPAFVLQDGETVQQMMARVNGGTPRSKEGCLPNGKARTGENILELMALAEEGCPSGMIWASNARFNYNSPSMGLGRGCLAFGMAVSDFVFGEERPLTMNRNLRALETGDMVYIRAGGASRVLILTGVDREEGTYTACELIEGGKIKWNSGGTLSEFIDSPITTVYSRG